jgi:hypothetical protein
VSVVGPVRCGVDGVSNVRSSVCGVSGRGVIHGMDSCKCFAPTECVGAGKACDECLSVVCGLGWNRVNQPGSSVCMQEVKRR